MEGKADWMAYGPVEGGDGPFVGQRLRPLPSCDGRATVAQARSVLEGGMGAVVADGLVIGLLDAASLVAAGADDSVLDAMEVVLSTVRPSVPASVLDASDAEGLLVTRADGRLLGLAIADDWAGDAAE